ncbi:hypothetical protein EMIHUDRAFT_204322 [Emiliania huxleyi CCMP1516]|uniref:Secreted protein n=2 Tax=Emiliania huxleyi TaxID=2903 RepID=A0A0D3JY63_EMIH1|nr:hypothetical protein EMIHUDRAFT_204322 [Emiliania huxleyi CCMP1516]EOD28448.1 hypothetical protein EMIHUDRAFT_204322 [Emiliania huxleyi CCMP1516]|eukprot:XP_005780877.1 hypothetical protein EMIHUDRAFT_204322 [Emiliania huxleyi CCMP1516]
MVPRSVEVAALLVPLPNVPSAADAVCSGSPVPGSALLSSALASVSSSLIASIPVRVSTILKPAQQLNRSLSRRSIISLTHFARCPLTAGRASFHPAKSFLSHSMRVLIFLGPLLRGFPHDRTQRALLAHPAWLGTHRNVTDSSWARYRHIPSP